MRSKRQVLALAVALAAALPAITRAQGTWKSLGPLDTGWVSDVAIVGSTAYAATQNGVFSSTDGGATWRAMGLAGEPVDRIVGRPGAPALFARVTRGFLPFSGALYVSRDGGSAWEASGLPSVLEAALDPSNPSIVYAMTSDGRLAKSTDAGATWSFPSNLPGDGYGRSLAFDASAIYALTSGVFRSGDGGASWAGVSAPTPNTTGLFSGRNGALLALGGSPGTFCRSTDGASTWACHPFPPGYLSSAERIVELPGAGVLLAIESDGLLSSDDGGATWTQTQATTSHDVAAPHGLAADDTGALVIGGSENGVLRSVDSGRTWTSSRAGLRAPWIDVLAQDPSDSSRLWASGIGHLYRTEDSGLTWSEIASPSSTTFRFGAMAIDPSRSSSVYVGGNRIFRTDDDGATWSVSNFFSGASALVIQPGPPQTIWAASGDLYSSEDGAQTFHFEGSISQSIQSLLFDQRRAGTVYAGGFYGFVEYGGYDYPHGGSIFVSYDRGKTFAKNDADFGDAVIAIVQDSLVGTVYAATYRGIFRSTDGGSTWQGTPTRPPAFIEALLADPRQAGQLYAGTTDGVYRSTDGGQTWASLSSGLAHSSVLALVMTPDGRRLRAATAGGGVFELDLETHTPIPCVPSDTRLCLVGGRYAVELSAHRGAGPDSPGVARPLGDRAGYFSLPFATGDSELPEIAVKMLADGAFGGSGAPLFYSSLTTLPFVLTVTDTATGAVSVYPSNPDEPLCGGNALAFREGAVAERAAAADSLALLGGRFTVTLEATHPRTGQLAGGAVLLAGDRFGIFSLPAFTGDPQFPEVVVKMVDARSFAGHFWFFHASLTSLDYVLTVTDSVTGAVRRYASTTPFCGDADTRAFANDDAPANALDVSGLWTGSMTFPTDCFTCGSPEEIHVTLAQAANTVTGHFTAACLGERAIRGALDGNRLTFDFDPISGTGDFTGTVTATALHVEKNCDPWGYGSDYTLAIDLSR
jgi:photosystem II stability/assembly factor-like uncharacterized protein